MPRTHRSAFVIGALVLLIRSWHCLAAEKPENFGMLQYVTPSDADLDNDEVLTDYQDVVVETNSLVKPTNTEQDIRFFCISGFVMCMENTILNQVFQNDANLTSKINVTKPIAFLVHGWMDSFFSTNLYENGRGWPINTVEDWVRFVDTNVCGVDWSPLSHANYISAALKNTHITAYWLARFAITVHRAGIPYNRFTIAGHSLGAQIAGFTGKNLALWASQRPGTIFGLDPAGPLFTFPIQAPPQNILQPTDADFVQIIHTSAFTYGVALGSHTGDASFTANGGIYQPGCLIATLLSDTFIFLCSHFRATQYFRSALNPRHRFIGQSCTTRAGGILGLLGMWKKTCPAPTEDLFGVWTRRLPGRFQLKTTGKPPFCINC